MALFASLRDRPPTPPLESTSQSRAHVERVTKATLTLTTSIEGSAISTPPSSSPPLATESGQRTSKKRKRVEWSPWTEYRKAPTFTGGGTWSDETHIRPIAPSRERKCSKSILKPYDRFVPVLATPSSPNEQQLSSGKPKSLAEMLESVVQQLAGEARSSRLDAYLTMNQALKHYTEFPSSSAIGEKMGLFMHFIQRDISAKIPASGALDSALVTQALKLLIIFIWKPQLSCHLTDDFCRTMIDNSITVLGSPPQPKVIIIHHLHLLSVQKFQTGILSANRADQIVSILNRIEESTKGTAVLCERLGIYQRLVTQAGEVMISRARDWLDHLFSGMVSSDKEVRARAIALGMAAALALGTAGQVSRAVKGIFDHAGEEEVTFARRMEQHLTRAIAAKEVGPDVPKIWTVVILFLRSRPRQLEQWDHLKPWLLIIQKCFNSADPAVKMQANIAWNRMIFAIYPRDWTGPSMIKTLRQPIVGQLEKGTSDRASTTQCQDLALASLCCLLYYSLRPSASPLQLEIYWEEYIVQIVVGCIIQNTSEVEYGLRILAALFDGTEQRAWKELRAIDSQSILPEELPRIDPKWVRSKTHTILKTCDIIFEKASWVGEPTQEPPIKYFWRNLTRSIADAGTMEVKLSAGLMEAVAHIFNLLQHIWSRGPVALGVYGDNASDTFLNRFGFLVTTTLHSLGPLAFTERFLTPKSKDELEAIGTPSGRSSKHHNAAGQSLLSHLFQLLARPSPDLSLTPAYHDLAKTTAEACCGSRKSFESQLAILNDCAHFLTPSIPQEDSMRLAWRHLWRVSVELAIPLLPTDATECILTSEYQQMIRFLVNVLHHGCRLDDGKSLSLWLELFHSSVAAIIAHASQDQVIQDLIEPIAGNLHLEADQTVSSIFVSQATCIVDNIPWPEEKTGREQIKSMNGLYEMMNVILVASYKQISGSNDAQIAPFLLSIKNSIARCPLPILTTFLVRIQDGLGLWIADGGQKLGSDEQSTRETYLALLSLGTEISHAVKRFPHKDSLLLRNIEVIVYSGLESRCESISEEARALWNSTFGTQETLEYPTRVQDALNKLRSVADLRLPCFPISAQDQGVIVDSRPSSTQEGRVESSSRPGKQDPGGSQAMLPDERTRRSPRVSVPSTPSGSLKQSKYIPLDRHTSDPTPKQRTPGQVGLTRRRQELLRASFDSEVTTITAHHKNKGQSDIGGQVTVVAETIRRSPAQRTSALDLCINSDTIDPASAIQVSKAAAMAANFDDVMETLEDSSCRSGTRSVSPSERRAAMQSPNMERSSRGIARAQKHNHSSPVSTSVQYDSNPRKRRSMSTSAESPAKRNRRVCTQQDTRVEEMFDCIAVRHSPSSHGSVSQQNLRLTSQPSPPVSSAQQLGHDRTVKGLESTGKKRAMDYQDEVDISEHLGTQVSNVSQVETTRNNEDSSKSGNTEGDLVPGKPPSKSIASRVKRRRLADRRGRVSPSEERYSHAARTTLIEGDDDISMVEETHIPITPDVSGESSREPIEHLSSGDRERPPSVSVVKSRGSEIDCSNESQGHLEQPTYHYYRSTRGVQTVSSNIKSIAQTPVQNYQVGVSPTPGASHASLAEKHTYHQENQVSSIGGSPVGPPPSVAETGEVSRSSSETQPSPSRPAVAGIIGGLKRILSDLRRAVLGPQEVRQIDDLLFDAKRETFAAERRRDGGDLEEP